ncbi:hypothetical protein BKA82DRAFT_4014084 [Pisolithus tinctorius]|nr:hypothetical protein BKA82DRAFT_4014084 [Pisolithus tinctorius]
MPEWFPWKAAVEWVLRIPHPLNTDWQKAGNSLISGTYIQGAACEVWVTQISSESCQNGFHGKLLLVDGRKAGNSLINGTYIQGAAYGRKAGNSVINGTYTPGAAYGRKAGNSLINGTYIQGAAYGRKAGNSVINGTYTPGAASAVERVLRIPHPPNTDGRKAGNSLINGTYIQGAAYWCPWKAAVERVLQIPHPLNTDGRKAGNSLINGTYIQGAAYGRKAGNSVINGTYTPGAAYGRKAGNSVINAKYTKGAAYWCPCKAAIERVLRIPHPLNTDGRKAGNSLINGTYIQGAACELRFMPEWCPWRAAVQRVLGIPHPLNTDERKAGNSVINAKYTKGAACEIWVTQISSNSCQTGVHAKPLLSSLSGLGHSNQLRFMPEWCPWRAAVQRVLGIPHPLNTDERKAGNSVINAKYTKGAACEIWVTQISSNSCQTGVHAKPLLSSLSGLGHSNQLRFMPEWCPWRAAVQRVLGIPHPLNTDERKAGNSVINAKYTKGAAYGRKAGNSLINGTYIQGAACEVWVTQISSDSCQNGVHGKLLFSGCWGYHIRSIQMSGWLAIV